MRLWQDDLLDFLGLLDVEGHLALTADALGEAAEEKGGSARTRSRLATAWRVESWKPEGTSC